MTTPEVQRAIETVWRLESPRLIGGLTRMVRDLALAEDLTHDALVAALEQWPSEGLPRNPGAWLMAAAKRRAIDQLRRRTRLARKHEELARDLDSGRPEPAGALDAALDDDIGDDVLRLIFTACHPVLSTEARVALTLRLLGGLTTDEIARAFLVPEPTIAQRIVRAKRTLANANVPFEVPRGPDRHALTAPRRAGRLADTPGTYHLQAAIAACHAQATEPAETDWPRIAVLYAALVALTGSPIVRLNHAVAVGMADGPAEGLALVDALLSEGSLDAYHYAPSVRGDLLEKLGRTMEARAEFERAAALTKNARERELLRARARATEAASG